MLAKNDKHQHSTYHKIFLPRLIFNSNFFLSFFTFQSTSLRDSSLYLKYYSLIGSLIVMVLIPIIILITTCIYLRSAIPDGQHKAKISRIMIIIICMFVVAHVPKVKPEYSLLDNSSPTRQLGALYKIIHIFVPPDQT